MSSFLAGLAHANLVLIVAIALVMILRVPIRARFGADAAYHLWVVPPIAALACILPLPAVLGRSSAFYSASLSAAFDLKEDLPAAAPWPLLVFALWIIGVAASICIVAFKQQRFNRLAATGHAGPAVVGVIFAKIVVPADFEAKFTAEERRLVLLHERAHLRRRDAQINALIALAQCVNWFNPLIHIAAFYARVDQELACDDFVIHRAPNDRRLYAEALLKTQIVSQPLPLGCYWPGQPVHPLEERIAMLNKKSPSKRWKIAGAAMICGLSLAAAAVSSATGQPAHVANATDSGLTMRLVARDGEAGVDRVISPDGVLLLEPAVLITGSMIATANSTQDGAGHAAVSVQFTAEGRTRFAALTKGNVGRKLAILVNGSVVSTPVIQREMSQGAAQVSGADLGIAEAEKLAAAIVTAR